ncbi:PilT/PilU family type 4a pilus ATPase [Acerihabitans sp. KWT182]|uniref:PilT/PilU family type 4a pilus ATPase n=1 Tax=Acerihabitans sp. KWT182 TaxID=3157919 RepID=A0AAU7Q9Q5_9GAMM
MNVDELVAHSVKHNASDLHLCPGLSPVVRIDGELRSLETLPPLGEDIITGWCADRLGPRARDALLAYGQADGAAALAGGQRLRAHFFRQRTGVSAAFRLIPSQVPTLAQLRIPPAAAGLLAEPRGLLLVTGAAGSGKSSSLAAMTHHLNHSSRQHIITLEDPIEFIHRPESCLIQQRQIGEDCRHFRDGLQGALREDPNVILLGELRDGESIRLALNAAETGHLVLGTLHARHACQAVDRLLAAFSGQEQSFARAVLAECLLAIMAQTLVPREGGGRTGLFELLVATPAVRNIIRDGKTHLLPGLLQTGKEQGMLTFDQSRRQQSGHGEPAMAVNDFCKIAAV